MTQRLGLRGGLYWSATGVVWLAVLVLAAQRSGSAASVDFSAVYLAGDALLHGQPLYEAQGFVYPPFAALVFAPFAFLRLTGAQQVFAVVQVVVPCAAAALVGGDVGRRGRVLAAGGAVLVLVKADVFVNSLFLGNPSLLFALPLALAGLLWARGRWGWGAVVLGLSIAVKPLLVLLVLVPALRRDGRTVLLTVAAAVVPTLLMLPFVHGIDALLHLPSLVAHGSNLHDDFQTNNTALASVAVVHPGAKVPVLLLRASLAVGVGALVRRSRGWRSFEALTVLLGGVALLLPVAGSLSEIHYSVLGLPACACLATGRLGRPGQVLGLVAAVILCAPLGNLHVHLDPEQIQLRWAFGCTLALIGCCIAAPRPGRPAATGDKARRTPSAVPAGQVRPG